jgi:hypothetical protein
MPRIVRCLAVLFVIGSILFKTPVHAQVPEGNGEPKSLDNLQAALPFVNWDNRAHGPLIAIVPERIPWVESAASLEVTKGIYDPEAIPTFDDGTTFPLFPPKDRFGLNASLVARHFSRRLIHFATLSIFAPPTMFQLNTDLKPADPFRGMTTEDKMLRLEVSLSTAQWQLLGSADGLGIGDLTQAQQPLFADLLPEKMTVEQQVVRQNDSGYLYGEPREGTQQALSEEQRQTVRIHLTRHAEYHLVDAQNEPVPEMSPFHSETVGIKKTALVNAGVGIASDSDEFSSAFGQTLRYEVSNRLKPSDLDLKLPMLQSSRVPLTGAKTVGDMLRAVRQKTGIDVYADGRLSSLTVYLSSDAHAVRAADLLESLCWALAATYRKVGPIPEGKNANDFAYVLTYDRVGLSKIHGIISDWAQRGEAQREATARHQSAQYNVDHDQYRSLNTLPVSSMTQVQRDQMMEGLRRLDKQRLDNPNAPVARPDRVGLTFTLAVSFVIPGVGEVGEGSPIDDPKDAFGDGEVERTTPAAGSPQIDNSEAQLIAAVKLGAVALPHAILSISPKTTVEAESVFKSAKGWGISEVRIATADDAEGLKLLADCVDLGKKYQLPVGAQISVVDVDAGHEGHPSAFEDLNVFGESYSQWAAHLDRLNDGLDLENAPTLASPPSCLPGRDMLAPESPETKYRLQKHLRAVSAIPGLADIALVAATVPGRNWWTDRRENAPCYGKPFAGNSFGYTVANRLAFLREHGYDPIDIEGDSDDFDELNLRGPTRLPGYDVVGNATDLSYEIIENTADPGMSVGNRDGAPDMRDVQAAWYSLRAKVQRDQLAALRGTIKVSNPALPVYLGLRVGQNDGDRGYQRWNDPHHVPFAISDVDKPETNVEKMPSIVIDSGHLTSARGESDEATQKFPVLKDITTAELMAVNIRDAIKPDPQMPHASAAKGIVIDCSAVDTRAIPTLLNGALLPVSVH